MSDAEIGAATYEKAVCPQCDGTDQTVVVETAPLKPPRMRCTECGWLSLADEQPA